MEEAGEQGRARELTFLISYHKISNSLPQARLHPPVAWLAPEGRTGAEPLRCLRLSPPSSLSAWGSLSAPGPRLLETTVWSCLLVLQPWSSALLASSQDPGIKSHSPVRREGKLRCLSRTRGSRPQKVSSPSQPGVLKPHCVPCNV